MAVYLVEFSIITIYISNSKSRPCIFRHFQIYQFISSRHLLENTSATYKFYWLLSIVEAVEQGNTTITKIDLFARMIANAWYTSNYFHVSFGKQDLIQNAVEVILKEEKLSIDPGKIELVRMLLASSNPVTLRCINHFNKNVPHGFLTPWYSRMIGENDFNYKNRIYSESQRFNNKSLYALYDSHIEMNPEWATYLQAHAN